MQDTVLGITEMIDFKNVVRLVNTDYIEKSFKQTFHTIKFPIRNTLNAYLNLPQEYI